MQHGKGWLGAWLAMTALVALTAGCPRRSGDGAGSGDLAGKKVLMVMPPRDFVPSVVNRVSFLLTSKGATVTLASWTVSEAPSPYPNIPHPTMLVSAAIPTDYDAIVFTDGDGFKPYYDDLIVRSQVQQAVDSRKIVAGIGVSAGILARAGVLRGRKVSDFSVVPEELTRGGATVERAHEAVHDGYVITAGSPAFVEQYGEAIIAALGG